MNSQSEGNNTNSFTITLELVPEDPQDADPALVYAVGRSTTEALQAEGYAIKPVYTGERGGFFVDVVIPFLNTVWVQKEVVLADVSALVTIFTPIVVIAKYLVEAHKQHIGKDSTQDSSIKFTTEIDEVPFAFEVQDLATAEAVMNLVRRFQVEHPDIASKVTNRSKAKLTGSIPRKPPRRRK